MIVGPQSRRGFLYRAGVGLVAAPAILKGLTGSAGAEAGSLFTLGVMSGDPGANHVTLWTRLAPEPLTGGGLPGDTVPVRVEVATDEGMADIIFEREIQAKPENGHAVRVLAKKLPSDRWLYYRFHALGESSRVGRTRTFPAVREGAGRGAKEGAREGGETRMRFALTSCQNYEQGFYAAWRDIAENRDSLDFIVHVGDYIYEDGATSTPLDPARVHNGAEIFSVEDYRNRYALYRLDQQLQDAQALFPLIHTPDDHEVDNNYAGLTAEEVAVFTGDDFARRRRNAYQVLFESMPYGPDVRLSRKNRKISLNRRLDYGDLASIFVLDTRQFRTDQAAEDGFGSTDPDSAVLEPVFDEVLFDEAIDDPSATLLGGRQERWLKRELRKSRSQWNVMAQQVMMTEWNLLNTARLTVQVDPTIPDAQKAAILPLFDQVDSFLITDAWDGYRAARTRLFDFLAKARPSNPVVLTGDIHSSWAANLLQDFSDPESDLLATEFVCTSISSTFLGIDPRPTDQIVKAGLPGINPQIAFFNGLFRGYCLCEVDRERWKTTYRAVGTLADAANTDDPLALVPRADSPVATDAVVEIEAGFNEPGSGKRLTTTFARGA